MTDLRRTAALLLVLALGVAACGSGTEGTTTTATGAETTAAAGDGATTTAASEGDGNPFHDDVWTADGPPDYSTFDMSGEQILWGGFGGQAYLDYRATYFDDFEELTGVEIVDASPFDIAEVRAQVESGNIQYDIIPISDYTAAAGCGELYEELPEEKFYRGQLQEGTASNPCVIPHQAVAFMVWYNEEVYGDNPPGSCEDFFDLENYPGSRGMWDSIVGSPLEIALLADGVAPEDMYPLDVDRALAKYDTIKDDLDVYAPLGAGQEAMANEDFDMMIIHQASGLRIDQAEGIGTSKYAPLWECSVGQISSFAILKGTPNLDAAMALAGYVLQPEPQARSMTIRASNTVLDPDVAIVPDDFPEWMSPYMMIFNQDEMPGNPLYMDAEYWAENFEDVEQRFQQWLVG